MSSAILRIEREAIFREMTPRCLDMCVYRADILEDTDYLVVKKNLGWGLGKEWCSGDEPIVSRFKISD